MRRVRLSASGTVQGVFFRASTRDEARRLGLTGWARNTSDGRVEVEAQGAPDAIDRLIAFCRQGPGHATVTDLNVEDADLVDGEQGFTAR